MSVSHTPFERVSASTTLGHAEALKPTNDGRLLGIHMYFENIAGGATNVTVFLAGDATHKRFTESKVVSIVADTTDPTKGFAVGNLEELGYSQNEYAGGIERIYYQLNSGTADIVSYLTAECD